MSLIPLDLLWIYFEGKGTVSVPVSGCTLSMQMRLKRYLVGIGLTINEGGIRLELGWWVAENNFELRRRA
ncbi:MAG: hypothetical protein IPJ48_11795 [Propionivibrio sp.]|uniref:Uncharacterized protein n=1 Tax=Candidatus Propionivibrio dominans TaxID=2954373 RepID=A0A9D7FG89_9RHOO|nr:hypothetical protein [Candidatus Propionivibrio dominans]